jgi:hypothetical protein
MYFFALSSEEVSTFVHAALTFDKLSKALSVWLKAGGVSKRTRPLAPGLCVYLTRIGADQNNNGKWLDVSNPISPPGHFKRLMRTRLGPMFLSPPTHYLKHRS